ncbi:MAG TPA: gluconate 2-dehydrogenase subunit 3 family protein [Verrucomicrobiae bacterium]
MSSERLPRRTVFKWFAAVVAASQLPELDVGTRAAVPTAKGYGTDPIVAGYYKPGDFWALTLTPEQRKTVTTLADVILPADHLGPAASEVRVPDYIDEWVSAPYPQQQKDRTVVLAGVQWVEEESRRRFKKDFASLSEAQKHAICDDICSRTGVKKEFGKAAEFFALFRNLAASAYYGTEAGWEALGYVGNVPLTQFDGPPKELLDRLGVEQTVK